MQRETFGAIRRGIVEVGSGFALETIRTGIAFAAISFRHLKRLPSEAQLGQRGMIHSRSGGLQTAENWEIRRALRRAPLLEGACKTGASESAPP
jgi:hypothetical protein